MGFYLWHTGLGTLDVGGGGGGVDATTFSFQEWIFNQLFIVWKPSH